MLRKRESGIWKREDESTENRAGRVDVNGEGIWSRAVELLDHTVIQI